MTESKKTCLECQRWNPDRTYFDFGYCENGDVDRMVIKEGSTSVIQTHRTFGCIMFEQRENNE